MTRRDVRNTTTSPWLENRSGPNTPAPIPDLDGSRFDHVVVRAGITGIATAVLVAGAVARKGRILGATHPWAHVSPSWRASQSTSVGSAAQMNATVVRHMVSRWIEAASDKADREQSVDGNASVGCGDVLEGPATRHLH